MKRKNNELARTLMIQGTASDVGKSLLTAAFCRILTEDGYATAPFKSQNMSLNSYVTWDGKEIGRAQGLQADACGILATTDMNPILLKPKKEMVSQVVVHGKPLGDFEARVYREEVLAEAGVIVQDALLRLREAYDVVVLEGAGSPAEINLKDKDIVNMRAAVWADAPVLLVADIDRGGVFASIVGTLELLEPHERDRVRGFIINKFRGDVSLLQPGLDWLEAKTGKPVLGVVPYLPNVGLEDEDSLSLDHAVAADRALFSKASHDGKLDIAVLRLPHISNFTDIDPLRAEEDTSVRFVASKEQWGQPDAVIVPGSKNTVDDLLFLRKSGLAALLDQFMRLGGHVVGICGGYEMFGAALLDPDHTESDLDETPGLGWFPFDVKFAAEKQTERVEGFATLPGMPGEYPVEGYEIHTGEVQWHSHVPLQVYGNTLQSDSASTVRPFLLRRSMAPGEQLQTNEFQAEGCASGDGRVWGTFLHGVLHNDDYRRAWLNRLRLVRGLDGLATGVRVSERREQAFTRLADHIRNNTDIERIKQIIGLSR
ncbi:cobyric acid synthase [Paenibacillus sp. R14(2021)]|uniref:cobyric acid synthase n=1 Tax=Paenibacillus sp. R14(2021) TaxID=2859228 RepID=UPI0021575F89|nr:cobyric acid synthase [Paenibacillus sp. R14(2021)]